MANKIWMGVTKHWMPMCADRFRYRHSPGDHDSVVSAERWRWTDDRTAIMGAQPLESLPYKLVAGHSTRYYLFRWKKIKEMVNADGMEADLDISTLLTEPSVQTLNMTNYSQLPACCIRRVEAVWVRKRAVPSGGASQGDAGSCTGS